MFLEMVDLVVQAVKGTRVGGYASAIRTYTGVQLIQLLDRVEEAFEELEARNEAGEGVGGVCLAERVGFEPTMSCPIPHFECGAFVRSAISPRCRHILGYPAGRPLASMPQRRTFSALHR